VLGQLTRRWSGTAAAVYFTCGRATRVRRHGRLSHSVMFCRVMRTRKDYDRAFAVVGKVVHAWDPNSFIGGGALQDEWDDEIARLVAQIPRMNSEEEVTNAISRTFSEAFQPEDFGPSSCADVGRELFQALKDSGLLRPKRGRSLMPRS